MIARAGSGWQTVLADLSLILFMVMAAAVSEAPAQMPPAPPAPPAPVVIPALGDPVAVWRAAPGGPSLAEWLASQPADPRQRLTLIASPADSAALFTQAAALPRPARIVIEPGLSGPPYAALTFDTGETP